MLSKFIEISGAKEHNLKNINISIPRNTLTVVTGMSGSGKSSLAFDTIYVEGQRRYVESLSAYARQFLDVLQKPDVDSISGLPPTIAIEQRKGHANPRSTVATTTEIYDYLRLLYARVGIPHCWKCGKTISKQTPQQIVDNIIALGMNKRIVILAPLVRGKKGEHKDVLATMKREGYIRARIDGKLQEIRELTEVPYKTKKHTIEAVIDRLSVKKEATNRLAEAIETSLKLANGLVIASIESEEENWQDNVYSENYGCVDCNVSFQELEPRIFSFNAPYGACPVCDGLGNKLSLDLDLIVPDPSKSLSSGAVQIVNKGGKYLATYYTVLIRDFAKKHNIDLQTPYEKIPQKLRDLLFYGNMGNNKKNSDKDEDFIGIIPMLEHQFNNTASENVKHKIHGYMAEQPCPACNGARLKPESLAVTVGGISIDKLVAKTTKEATDFFEHLHLDKESSEIAKPICKEVSKRLNFMSDVGLDYLNLNRMTGSLSGGEHQRIRLASQVGSGLVGVCYVLDEPTIGLHQRDNDKLINTLTKIRDLGNTVVVVEHDEDVMKAADYLIDIGPGAGLYGGEIIAQGTVKEVTANPKSLTGQYLSGKKKIFMPEKRREVDLTKNVLTISGLTGNNLKNITANFPLSIFTCVTGVSGSGKSTLVNYTLCKALKRLINKSKDKPEPYEKITGLDKVDKLIEIDQSAIGKTPRSNPATYTGIFDDIRKIFTQVPEAKMRGYLPGRFSFNVKGGRCEHCEGAGLIKIEMHFLPDVFVQCEQCKGQRYNRETLEIKYRGKTISDVLNMSVQEALEFFQNIPTLREGLTTLNDVGLGYIKLGQSSTTLSGGEAQRVKLATELSKRATGKTIYILDEPTTGLHFEDINKLLDVLNRLVDMGNTVIVIEHNLDVIKCADWIIDLGIEGGNRGGEIIGTGRPEEIINNKNSYTGKYLKPMLVR